MSFWDILHDIWVQFTTWLMSVVVAVFQWLLDLLGGGLGYLVRMLPDVPVPSWVGDAVAMIISIMGPVTQMSAWIPAEVFIPVLGGVLAVSAVALAIRIARIVASFATLGGGA